MTDETISSPDSVQIKVLQKERDELSDRLLRTTAEFDNYRKPAVDDLERALAAAGKDAAPAFRRGIELIHRRLLDALRKRGVEPLDVIGQPFDPNWHEAVGHDEAADGQRDGEITAELTRGYRIGQRLLRPAQVKVAKA